MDAATTAAVLSALGVGGVAGSLLRAEHERTEWHRERMMAAGDEFLNHAAEARRLLDRGMVESARGNREEAKRTFAEAAASTERARVMIPRLDILFADGRVRKTAVSLADGLTDWRHAATRTRVTLHPAEDGDDDLLVDRVTLPEADPRLAEAIRAAGYYQGFLAALVHRAVRRRWRL